MSLTDPRTERAEERALAAEHRETWRDMAERQAEEDAAQRRADYEVRESCESIEAEAARWDGIWSARPEVPWLELPEERRPGIDRVQFPTEGDTDGWREERQSDDRIPMYQGTQEGGIDA